jgi:hypothetical protein
MTLEGERRIPFYSYVQPRRTTAALAGQGVLFRCFSALPLELQIRILTLCSARTLFQMMQVSSVLRAEACKVFWANPNAYFLVQAEWLLGGGYPGCTYSDVPFLAHVQNVQIDYWEGTDSTICLLRNGTLEIRQDRITEFWRSFTRRCPDAKRVIINQCWMSPLWRKETQPIPRALQILLDSCPPGIQASAFVVRDTESEGLDTSAAVKVAEKWQRSVYQQSSKSTWVKVQSGQNWKTILTPTKRFQGPVGRFHEMRHRGLMLELQEDGLWPLTIEALGRHQFQGGRQEPFFCPAAECRAYLEGAEEWLVHAAELHYQEWMRGERFAMLPQGRREEFEARARVLKRRREEVEQRGREIVDEWNKGGKGKQKEIEDKWIEQLESDRAWDTGKKGSKSQLWEEFWQEMNC